MNNKIKIYALMNIIIIFFIDQISKHAIVSNIIYSKSIPLFGVLTTKLNFGFALYLTYNRGSAFSLIKFASSNVKLLLIGSSIIIILVLLYWLYKENSKNKLNIIAVSCILGGAFGNIYDRINLGYVIDFFDLYVSKYHWPIFNVADVAVAFGVFLLIWQLFFVSSDR